MKKNKKAVIILCICFLICVCSAGMISANSEYKGIDVSVWQGDINFKEVKKDGIEAVYIRAGQGSNYTDTKFERNYKEAKKEDLEILSYENLNDGMLRYVTGQVKNNTDKNYSYVQIEIKMYKDDTVLGSTLDNMNNLGPGETWQFKAIITDNECNKYTIVGVTGF